MKLTVLLAGMLAFATALAQEAETDTPENETEVEASEEEIDESGLDVQGFEEEDDDDFVPTEDIPTDQSIPFPTDI